MDLPTHPERNESDETRRRQRRPATPARILVGALLAVAVLVIVLHLTGIVGPAR
jgi:hypothetical protein